MTHFKCPNCNCIEYNMGHECLTCGNHMMAVADYADDRIAELTAELAKVRRELDAERKRAAALSAFAREAFAACFNGCDWDGSEIQEKGAELGLLRKEQFDIEKHPGVDATEVEPGETIYVFTELMGGSNDR